nr:hypothetical protein H661L_01338 [Campylobacter jejuni]CAH1409750.1 hypothetical protein H660L_01757 [Campylobacter jejuni]
MIFGLNFAKLLKISLNILNSLLAFLIFLASLNMLPLCKF